MKKHPFVNSSLKVEDVKQEAHLRPQTLHEFYGQKELCEKLQVTIGAAKSRKEVLGHTLFSGPPGLGKTTLAHIIANSMEAKLVVTSGPVIEKPGDLAGILTSLNFGDVLFIDEIHRLNRTVEEYLYPAMEDFSLDIMIDSGPSARSVKVSLKPFTLVGATTRTGLLTAPLRSRFVSSCRLNYYSPDVLKTIVMRSSSILNIEMDEESALEIAKRSRGTPRIVNNLLRWVRDYSQMKAQGCINVKVVKDALEMLAIDERGLDEMDLKLLEVLIDHYQGGPVGVGTLAVALGEEAHTLEEVYEPYLILQGLLKRTPRGREATALAYQHLNKMSIKNHQGEDEC